MTTPVGASAPQFNGSTVTDHAHGNPLLDVFPLLPGAERPDGLAVEGSEGFQQLQESLRGEIQKASCPGSCHEPSVKVDPAVETFKYAVRFEATERLRSHQGEIRLEAFKFSELSDDNPNWARLEAGAAKLQEIDEWEKSQTVTAYCGSGACHTGPEHRDFTAFEKAKAMRQDVMQAVPALALLSKEDLANLDNRSATRDKINAGAAHMNGEIDRVIHGINSGDVALHKLGNLSQEVQDRFEISEAGRQAGDSASTSVLNWIDGEQQREATLNVMTAGGATVLGVGALFSGGGVAAFLGLAGAGIGLGGALYNFEMADDIYSAAEASSWKGKPFSTLR